MCYWWLKKVHWSEPLFRTNDEVLLGPLGQGSGDVFGWFIDDFWCSNIINGTGSCGDPVQGPTEVDPHSQADMGLSDEDIADITRGWLAGMTAAQAAIANAGGYTWSRIPGQDNANAEPVMVSPTDAAACAAKLRPACSATSPWVSAPLLAGVHFSGATTPTIVADVAAFLIMRGPWAWIGAGYWGLSWPTGETWNSTNTPVSRPPELDADYGAPLGACTETAPGVFERQYQHAAVRLDCAHYAAATITMH